MSHHKTVFTETGYQYPDGFIALTNINFSAQHGDAIGIIGANGAGKTTLLQLLAGLLLPTEGSVAIGDVPMNRHNLLALRRHIGYVFQNPDDQLFMNSVIQDVMFGPLNLGLDTYSARQKAEAALEAVGLTHLMNKPPYTLSGGEKRAAAIASVLSMEPDILVLDEPTDALDPGARRRLIRLLCGFTHTRFITSHDLDFIWDVCTRTIVLHKGNLVAEGPTTEILSNESLLLQCGLELPLSLQRCATCKQDSGSS